MMVSGAISKRGGVLQERDVPADRFLKEMGARGLPIAYNLNGAQALGFARDRHSFNTSDLRRMQDQRAFLKALLAKATSPGVYLNPFTAYPFASSAAGAVSVDKGTHLYDLVQVAFALRNPQTGTVPIATANYATANAGTAVLWNRSQALALFSAMKNGQTVPPSLLSGTKVG